MTRYERARALLKFGLRWQSASTRSEYFFDAATVGLPHGRERACRCGSDETRLSPNDCECEQNIALKDDVFSRLDAWVQLFPTGS